MNVRSLRWHSLRTANRFRGSATSARDICFHLPARLESVASTLRMLRHACFVGTKRKRLQVRAQTVLTGLSLDPEPSLSSGREVYLVVFPHPRSMREYRRPSRDWRWVAETPLGWGINGSMHRLGWVMCPLTSIRNAHATFFLLNSPSTSLSIDYSSRISVDRLWGAYNTKREGLLFGRSSL